MGAELDVRLAQARVTVVGWGAQAVAEAIIRRSEPKPIAPRRERSGAQEAQDFGPIVS